MSHFTHQQQAGISSVHQTKDGQFHRGVTANQKATMRAFDKFYSMFPHFLDIFPDEDAFLDFAFYFCIVTVVTVFILARYYYMALFKLVKLLI
jgi:hypothetical protein